MALQQLRVVVDDHHRDAGGRQLVTTVLQEFQVHSPAPHVRLLSATTFSTLKLPLSELPMSGMACRLGITAL